MDINNNTALATQSRSLVRNSQNRENPDPRSTVNRIIKTIETGNPDKLKLSQKNIMEQKQLTLQQKLQIQELKRLEQRVRQHEMAHLRAARDIGIGSPRFEYQIGPDGKKYAVHGEVKIDASGVQGDTEATIKKALKIQHSALAPSDPSVKDMETATRARIMEAKARRKLSRELNFERQNRSSELQDQVSSNEINVYKANMSLQENMFIILDLFA